jgi:hypothetical protein
MPKTLRTILSFFFLLTILASPQTPQPAEAQKIDETIRLEIIPPSDLLPREMPVLLTAFEIDEYTRELVNNQAAPLLTQLAQLQVEGKINSFTFLSDQLVIEVNGINQGSLLQTLKESGNEDRILFSSKSSEQVSECPLFELERFRHHVADLALIRLGMQTRQQTATSGILAFATTLALSPIEVGITKGGYTTAFGGTVAPNRLVRMTHLRGGQLVITKTTASLADGTYFFDVDYGSCLGNGQSGYILEGDEIIVEDGLAVYQTVVRGIDAARLDPFQNSLEGSTGPGRSVLVELHNLATTPAAGPAACDGSTSQTWATAHAQTGDFSIALPDFNSSAWAVVSSYDSANNRTYVTQSAYHIWNKGYSYAYVTFRPDTTYLVEIVRNGLPFYSESMQTDLDGRITLDGGPWSFQPGDVIRVAGEGQTLALKLDMFYPSPDGINLATKKIDGYASPGRLVRARMTHFRGNSSFTTGCSTEDCVSGYAGANGIFSLDAPGMLPGDISDITTYDEQGNQEYGQAALPILAADASANVVSGRLLPAWTQYNLTIRLKDGSGSILEEKTTYTYGDFYVELATPMLSGYVVEVVSGAYSASSIIRSLSARAVLGENSLAGSASPGKLFVRMKDFQPELNQQETICTETTASGSYQVGLNRTNRSDDVYQAVLVGPDGSVMFTQARPFSLMVTRNGVFGYPETRDAEVTITHTHQGQQLPPVSVGTNPYGVFSYNSPTSLDPGDQIAVQTSDGTSTALTIPDLWASYDGPGNRVVGHALPNRPVRLGVNHRIGSSEERRDLTARADAGGNFAVSLTGQYWSVNCAAISAAEACAWLDVSTYTTDDFEIFHGGSEPPAQPDKFEPTDNVPNGAIQFFPGQIHTFHTAQDVDWYQFPILPSTTGTYVFNLARQGTSFQVKGGLYLDGQETPVQEFILPLSGYGYPVFITLNQPGIYRLRVEPADNNIHPACDTYYVLSISPSPWVPRNYLPVIQRNN